MKALEDHADGFARLAQLPGREGGEIPPVHQDLALRWPLQQIDAAHQGALARPGQADDAEDVSVLDAQRDVLQRLHLPVGGGKGLGQLYQFDHTTTPTKNRPYKNL